MYSSEEIAAVKSNDITELPPQENMYGYTPLHMACSWPQPEVVQKLIELGANLDARNNELKTPLALACDEGSTKVMVVQGGLTGFYTGN